MIPNEMTTGLPDGLPGYLLTLALSWSVIICIDLSWLINTNCSNGLAKCVCVCVCLQQRLQWTSRHRNYTVSGCLACCLSTGHYHLSPTGTHSSLFALQHTLSLTHWVTVRMSIPSREYLVKYGLVQTVISVCSTLNSTQLSRLDPSDTRLDVPLNERC